MVGLSKKVGFDFKEHVRHAVERRYGGSWLSIFYKPDQIIGYHYYKVHSCMVKFSFSMDGSRYGIVIAKVQT